MMRTCKEVGAMRQYMQSHAQDELLKIYRREYKRRFAWIRADKISQMEFAKWLKQQCRYNSPRCLNSTGNTLIFGNYTAMRSVGGKLQIF